MHKGLCTNLCGPFGPFGAKKREKGTNLMISWVHPMNTSMEVPKGPFGGLFGPKRGSKLAIIIIFFSERIVVAIRPI